MAAQRHVVIVFPIGLDDPISESWPAITVDLRSADGRGMRGWWENQIIAIMQRRGWTLAQMRNALLAQGCLWFIRSSVVDDPADANSGDRWKLQCGWVDNPALATP